MGEDVKINDDFNAVSASSSLIKKKKIKKNKNLIYSIPITTYNNC